MKKAVIGKDDCVEKILMAILGGGHVLMDDIPGVGKTTMALAFSRSCSLEENRMQFTPDVMPSDITGFSIYRKDTSEFVYQPGPIMCNLFLADEINKATGNRYHYVYDRHSVRQKRDPHELGLHAIRGGSIVGDHEILFCGPDEVITLSHSAGSRAVFANGAINAAVFLTSQKNGLYDMKDLMRSLL